MPELKVFALIARGPNDIEIPCRVWISEDINGPLSDCVAIFGSGGPRWFNFWDEPGGKTYPELFTAYYGGCGECDCFELREIPQNAPFVEWNLD